MKSNQFLALICLLIAGLAARASAQAADWKGLYLGGHAGGAIGTSDASTTTVFSPTGYFATSSVPAIARVGAQQPTLNGFNGGGQAGYNFQSGRAVLGAEVDFGALPLSDTPPNGTAQYPCCAPTTFTVKQTVKTNWLFTARPRVGFTAGKALFYGTGGLALTHLSYKEVFTDTFATAHENAAVDETKIGWTAGGGLEYQVAQHWSLKAEYLYVSFGQVSTTSSNLTAFTPPIAFPTNVFTHKADFHSHIARAGFNYRF